MKKSQTLTHNHNCLIGTITFKIHSIRTVQKTQRPAQPGQPARVRPAATRSEDSDGRTRVPAKLT